MGQRLLFSCCYDVKSISAKGGPQVKGHHRGVRTVISRMCLQVRASAEEGERKRSQCDLFFRGHCAEL